MWRSISTIFSTEWFSRRVDVTRFSTPRTTPPPVATPIAVDPSLIASREYSTWNRRPSGEKVLYERSALCEGQKVWRSSKEQKENLLDTPIYCSISYSSELCLGSCESL